MYLKELSFMLKAGLSLQLALDELYSEDKSLNIFLSKLKTALASGSSLTNALKYSKFFDKKELILIQMGEENARLPWALEAVIELKEKNIQSKKELSKALRYPILVFASIIIAFIFLVLFVVPKFSSIYESLGILLPNITLFLIASESFLRQYLYILVLIFLSLILIFKYSYKHSKSFGYFIDSCLLKLPLIGKLIFYHEKYYFFTILSKLLEAGLNTKSCIVLSVQSIKNRRLLKAFSKLSEQLELGQSLEIALKNTGFFESFSIQMIKIGLKTARLAELCQNAAKYYQSKEDELNQRIFSLLEPIATFFVACLVLILALGIFMPMWELSSRGSF